MLVSLFVTLFTAAVLPTPYMEDPGETFEVATWGESAAKAAAPALQSVPDRFDPAAVLRRQNQLTLTEEQVAALTSLRNQAITEKQEARASYESRQAQLREALVITDPNPAEVRSLFDAAQTFRALLSWIDIRVGLEAREVLTEEQKLIVRTRSSRRRG